MDKRTGVVRWFSRPKGYGFIVPDDPDETQGREVYAHWSKLIGCEREVELSITHDRVKRSWLEEGQRVSYVLADGPHGPYGLEITPVSLRQFVDTHEEEEGDDCTYPNCGCDSARVCPAKNGPNMGAYAINKERK